MTIQIAAHFVFTLDQPSDVLLQFEAAAIPEQDVLEWHSVLPDAEHIARIAAEDAIGERVWARLNGRCEVDYTAKVEVHRLLAQLDKLDQLEPHLLRDTDEGDASQGVTPVAPMSAVGAGGADQPLGLVVAQRRGRDATAPAQRADGELGLHVGGC